MHRSFAFIMGGLRRSVIGRLIRRLVGWRPGVQTRFTATVAALAIGVGVVAGTLTYRLTSSVLDRATQRHSKQMAQQLARRAAPMLAGKNDAAIQSLVTESIRETSFLFVSVLDVQGQSLASAVAERFEPAVTEGLTPHATMGEATLVRHSRAGEYVDVSYPISASDPDAPTESHNAKLLGYVRTAMSVGAVRSEVATAFDLMAGVTIILLAMTLVVSFLVVRLVTTPLKSLAEAMSRFADGDLTARSMLKRGDEIGQLAKAYNQMADRLAAKQAETQQLNAELESRVKQRTQQLRELAARDSLTGLYNRRHFNDVLRHSFAEAARYGGSLACVMVDVDNFKRVNDQFGHQVGDEVLIMVGEIISRELRSADVAARVGGDEFVALLPQTDARNAYILANRIRSAFARTVVQKRVAGEVTLSVGVASSDDSGVTDHRSLIEAADKALYGAKHLGKNRVSRRLVAS